MSPGIPSYVDVKPDPRIIERLQRKVRAAENLCKALSEWLCFEATESLADATRPYTPPPYFTPTPEMLVKAQEHLERARLKLQKLEEYCNSDDHGMGEFVRAALMPALEQEVTFAEEQVSNLQAQIEASARDKDTDEIA